MNLDNLDYLRMQWSQAFSLVCWATLSINLFHIILWFLIDQSWGLVARKTSHHWDSSSHWFCVNEIRFMKIKVPLMILPPPPTHTHNTWQRLSTLQMYNITGNGFLSVLLTTCYKIDPLSGRCFVTQPSPPPPQSHLLFFIKKWKTCDGFKIDA
jgi:hypothetical protein